LVVVKGELHQMVTLAVQAVVERVTMAQTTLGVLQHQDKEILVL
jgi:hypothetical protein